MKKTFSFFAAALLMVSCGKQGPLQVTVTNSLDVDRKGELVEVCMEKVSKQLGLTDTTQFVVVDEAGAQVPYQLTHDGKLIFPADVTAGGSAVYTIQVGTPQEELFEMAVFGKKYPERFSASDISLAEVNGIGILGIPAVLLYSSIRE